MNLHTKEERKKKIKLPNIGKKKKENAKYIFYKSSKEIRKRKEKSKKEKKEK